MASIFARLANELDKGIIKSHNIDDLFISCILIIEIFYDIPIENVRYYVYTVTLRNTM